MSIELSINDNTEEFLSALGKVTDKALEEIGLVAERHAKKYCPVDTGRLRNSITHDRDSSAAYIGTNVEYAPYVELGTSKQKEKPYLRPAAQNHKSQYESILKKNLENA